MGGLENRAGNCVEIEEAWVDRRRRWSEEQKRSMVEETFQPDATVSSVARKYKVPLASLFRWRRSLRPGAVTTIPQSSDPKYRDYQDSENEGFGNQEGFETAQIRHLLEQVKELQRLLGKITLENEMLRETIVQISEQRRKLVV